MKMFNSIKLNKIKTLRQIIAGLVFCLLVANTLALTHHHPEKAPDHDHCLVCQHLQLLDKSIQSNAFQFATIENLSTTYRLILLSDYQSSTFYFNSRAPPV